jgi:hypothetical protein
MTIPLTQTVIEAARAGGEALVALRDRPRAVTSKGFRDEVTDADYAAQAAIFAAIHAHAPEALIVSEENQFGHGIAAWEPPAGLWWMTDPGTHDQLQPGIRTFASPCRLGRLEWSRGRSSTPARQMFRRRAAAGRPSTASPCASPRGDLAGSLETGLRGRDHPGQAWIFNAWRTSPTVPPRGRRPWPWPSWRRAGWTLTCT